MEEVVLRQNGRRKGTSNGWWSSKSMMTVRMKRLFTHFSGAKSRRRMIFRHFSSIRCFPLCLQRCMNSIHRNKLVMQCLTVLRGWCLWRGQCTEVGTRHFHVKRKSTCTASDESVMATSDFQVSWQLGVYQSRPEYSNFRNGDPRAEKIWQPRSDISTFKPLHSTNCTPLHFTNVDS